MSNGGGGQEVFFSLWFDCVAAQSTTDVSNSKRSISYVAAVHDTTEEAPIALTLNQWRSDLHINVNIDILKKILIFLRHLFMIYTLLKLFLFIY